MAHYKGPVDMAQRKRPIQMKYELFLNPDPSALLGPETPITSLDRLGKFPVEANILLEPCIKETYGSFCLLVTVSYIPSTCHSFIGLSEFSFTRFSNWPAIAPISYSELKFDSPSRSQPSLDLLFFPSQVTKSSTIEFSLNSSVFIFS